MRQHRDVEGRMFASGDTSTADDASKRAMPPSDAIAPSEGPALGAAADSRTSDAISTCTRTPYAACADPCARMGMRQRMKCRVPNQRSPLQFSWRRHGGEGGAREKQGATACARLDHLRSDRLPEELRL